MLYYYKLVLFCDYAYYNDSSIHFINSASGTQKKTNWIVKLVKYLFTLLIYGGVIYATVVLFGFKLQPGGAIDSKIGKFILNVLTWYSLLIG